MGSELQTKYQKLAQEYAKLRTHVDILKKAVRDEQAQKAALEESLRGKTLDLRKFVQENESLEFRNQQLSKRVAMLQEELNSPSKNKRKKGGGDGQGLSDVHHQELAAKIAENERLHMKILELTQRSERTINDLQSKISSLEREVSTHNAVVDELNKEHDVMLETLRTDKAMVEVKVTKQSSELKELKKTVDRLQNTVAEERQRLSPSEIPTREQRLQKTSLLDNDDTSYTALNVPVIDTKLQANLLTALKSGMELVTTFTTQLSTFHSYLEQRCKLYPVDISTGLHISTVNQKLCELLLGSSTFTRPLAGTLSAFCDKLEANPFSDTSFNDLVEFANAHHKFVAYLQTLTPYLQLSLQEETSLSVCGIQLSTFNLQIVHTFPILTGAFESIDDYINILTTGPTSGVPPTNSAVCLQKLQSSFKHLQQVLNDLSAQFSSKITQEYQLPTATQKLFTTNECVVSALGGIHSTVQQLCVFLANNNEVFAAAVEQNSPNSETKQQPSSSSVVPTLRMRATGYLQRLHKECPPSVPYTLAVYNAQSLSSSSESKETLMKQVTANHEKLAKLEHEKEQLVLDLQLLRVKHEKEQKKVGALETALAQQRGLVDFTPAAMSSQPKIEAPVSPSSASPPPRGLSESVGSLSTFSAGDTNEDTVDDTEMIRNHFVGRIADLNNQVQAGDGKAAHYYAECRALHKQLNHNMALKTKLAQNLQTAEDNVQQLQDQLATTSSSYEKQLSTMSDHLCELNDRLMKQSEDLDILKKQSTKGKRWGK